MFTICFPIQHFQYPICFYIPLWLGSDDRTKEGCEVTEAHRYQKMVVETSDMALCVNYVEKQRYLLRLQRAGSHLAARILTLDERKTHRFAECQSRTEDETKQRKYSPELRASSYRLF